MALPHSEILPGFTALWPVRWGQMAPRRPPIIANRFTIHPRQSEILPGSATGGTPIAPSEWAMDSTPIRSCGQPARNPNDSKAFGPSDSEFSPG
jgi:hypothetical protein